MGNDGKRKKYWEKHIKAWGKSGLKKEEYCQQQGISRWTLGHWITKLNKKMANVPFVEIPKCPAIRDTHKVSPGQISQAPLALIINTEYRIEIGDNFNPTVLAEIIQTIRRVG